MSIVETHIANLKLVLLGESSVGKTSIVTRYTTGNYQKTNATIGAAFFTKSINLSVENGVLRKVNMEIWDTAGQERYRSLTPIYYRNADAALVVFDVTKPESLRKAQSWIDELYEYCNNDRPEENIHVIVVGNKVDLDHEPLDNNTDQEFVLVSAKTGEGVMKLFDELAENVAPEKFVKQEDVDDTVVDPFKISRKQSCSC
ncbi:YPT10 (YBR264C) [Zygosaccharomyces parabailii]|nr:YPT10 (YBR264C) [Zygosaccharomyces parabailii]CDH11342.1 related to GTP-binding protein YPT10 [Zygosaccharomyces bailii ISA1307]